MQSTIEKLGAKLLRASFQCGSSRSFWSRNWSARFWINEARVGEMPQYVEGVQWKKCPWPRAVGGQLLRCIGRSEEGCAELVCYGPGRSNSPSAWSRGGPGDRQYACRPCRGYQGWPPPARRCRPSPAASSPVLPPLQLLLQKTRGEGPLGVRRRGVPESRAMHRPLVRGSHRLPSSGLRCRLGCAGPSKR